MVIPKEFDDFRPYTPKELPRIYELLIKDAQFKEVIMKLFPKVDFDLFASRMHLCRTNQEFQEMFCYPFLYELATNHSDGLTINASAISNKGTYTFVSNHRDIILDSAFLSILLVEKGMKTVEIAIGDNLLIYPWIERLVRVNKSFIVRRSLPMHEMLEASARMSRYMHFAIAEKREPLWIAQREGRAKDANDRTQESVLKMLAMGGDGDVIESLRSLHIVPLAISYEYDPCDYLKAREFQLKRDNPAYKKSTAEDLLNMQTGLYGYKGQIHFAAAPCIDAQLLKLNPKQPRHQLFAQIATLIDRGIHANYRMYVGNFVAYDLLTQSNTFSYKYCDSEKEHFEKYLAGQLAKIDIPNKDEAFLRECLLTMYANPLRNYLKARVKCNG